MFTVFLILLDRKKIDFAPSFYSLLQNILMAESPQQSNGTAFGKTQCRVVTLDGKLIDKSGTVSGRRKVL